MASIPDHAAIYKKLHDQREEHVDQARRARDLQAELAEMTSEKYEGQILALLKKFWRDESTK